MEKSQDSDVLHIPEKNQKQWVLRELIRQSEIEREVLDVHARFVESHIVPMKEMEELVSDDLSNVSCVINQKEHECRPNPDRFYGTVLRMGPEEMLCKWRDIDAFVAHDIANIQHYSLRIHAEVVGSILRNIKGLPYNFGIDLLDGEWDGFYREILAEYGEIFSQMYYPHQFVRAVAELELGREVSEVEHVDLDKLTYIIARSLQIKQIQDDYIISTPNDRKEDRNEIVLNLNESSLETNPGMIWSIIFNLMKNASKELSCDNRPTVKRTGLVTSEVRNDHDLYRRIVNEELPKEPVKLYVKTEELSDSDLTLIHVGDNGRGLQIEEIMESIKNVVEKEMLHETNLNTRVKRILASWQSNPFAIRALRLGDVFDMAGVARLSGFVTRQRLGGQFSSGMGLWGAEFLSSKLGGEIIYTNTIDGGALFTVIVPSHYLKEHAGGTGKRAIRSTVNQTRKAIEAGVIPVDFAA